MTVYGNRASHKPYYVLVSDIPLFRTEDSTPGARGFEPVINGKKILLLFSGGQNGRKRTDSFGDRGK